MPTFFKGAAPRTHWYDDDARLSGFTVAAANRSVPAIVRHITSYSHPSPYLSLSASFAVARAYALGPAGIGPHGYVYEIDIVDEKDVALIHPISEIIQSCSAAGLHFHDGEVDLIQGIAAHGSAKFKHILTAAPHRRPGAASFPPTVTRELQALVTALRDAEVLATAIPHGCIVTRHPVT
jgi:hypothetical protein